MGVRLSQFIRDFVRQWLRKKNRWHLLFLFSGPSSFYVYTTVLANIHSQTIEAFVKVWPLAMRQTGSWVHGYVGHPVWSMGYILSLNAT